MRYWLGIAALLWMSLVSANSPNDTLQIPRLDEQATIDGKLDDAVWQRATKVSMDIVSRPYLNTPSPIETTAYFYENGITLFLGFDARDPNPDMIRALYRDRDSNFSDDMIGVKIDTHADGRLAYQFFANPYGIQSDAIENQMTNSESAAWDAIWRSAGQIHPQGYVVEMAIPLSILKFEEREGIKRWAMEFVRFYPRNETLRISNLPWDRNNACFLCQMGPVEGFADAKQGRNIALVPSLVLGKGESRDPYQDLAWGDTNVSELSFDAKWSPTPEIGLLATFNPDFSQVEADVAKLSVNNNFALFFPEKRTFFTENAEYFDSLYRFVYTRNIQDPDVGLKLTGRKGAHTLGVFAADDTSTLIFVPGNLGSSVVEYERPSNNLVARYRYDVSKDFAVGFLSTQRRATDYSNSLNAVDMKYQWSSFDVLRAQVAASQSEYPADLYRQLCEVDCASDDLNEGVLRLRRDDRLSDTAYNVDYKHERRDWMVRMQHLKTGADFRSDLGFENFIDRKRSLVGGHWRWFKQNSWWNTATLYADWDITHSEAGELLEVEREAQLYINASLQTEAAIGLVERDVAGLRHDTSSLAITGNSNRFIERGAFIDMHMSPSMLYSWGIYASFSPRKVDYANDRIGVQRTVAPSVELNLGKHMQVTLRHTRSALNADNASVFVANLTDLRMTYQFDAKQFLRLIAVRSDIQRNQANYIDAVDEDSRSLNLQLLYSYKVNPLTKFYVGYSQAGFSDDTFTQFTDTDRSIFMKVSYAWQQ
ncbi:MAG: hypothetical protein RL336_1024 [Pseudomonadota bacterium]